MWHYGLATKTLPTFFERQAQKIEANTNSTLFRQDAFGRVTTAQFPAPTKPDALYELTQVTQGANTTESYSYDPVGNRLSSLGVASYAYNNSNELTSTTNATYTYDNNDNTLTKTDSTGTTIYAWDYENRLTSVTLPGSGGTVSFKYDPFGRRIYKSSSGGTSIFAYDGDNLIEEANTAGTAVARYMQGVNIDEPLAALRSGATNYYEADGLGTVTSLSNASGALAETYAFDSFGKQTSSAGSITNTLRYTARDFDSETNLYSYRARYYDPAMGRFISEDPSGFAGGENFYRYVHNNVADARDPLGLWDSYTHDALIWNALVPCGVDPAIVRVLQLANDAFDASTGLWPWDANKHGMASPGQDPMDAWAGTENFIGNQLANAQSAYGSGADWFEPFAEAIHASMDTTSPLHRQNDVPLVWPSFPNFLHHGGGRFSNETWSNMTPDLMQFNIANIRNMFQQVTGQVLDCDCTNK